MESEFLKLFLERIDRALQRVVCRSFKGPHKQLFEAATYALFPGGKRLRPLFVLAATCDLGGRLDEALFPACSIELIHTYSLIHDDLPCMDDDAVRRGKPSLHVAFDEGLAVLTGDYLQALAFEVLSEAPHLSEREKCLLIHTLAMRSGGDGMIGGQVVDIAKKGKQIDKKTQKWIAGKKTGALFACALEFGGIIARACANDISTLRQVGEHFGLAFQQYDDMLDGEGQEMGIHFEGALNELEKLENQVPHIKKLIETYIITYV